MDEIVAKLPLQRSNVCGSFLRESDGCTLPLGRNIEPSAPCIEAFIDSISYVNCFELDFGLSNGVEYPDVVTFEDEDGRFRRLDLAVQVLR